MAQVGVISSKLDLVESKLNDLTKSPAPKSQVTEDEDEGPGKTYKEFGILFGSTLLENDDNRGQNGRSHYQQLADPKVYYQA